MTTQLFFEPSGRSNLQSTQQSTQQSPTGWRQSKWLIVVELAIVFSVFVADAHHLIPISKTPALLLLAWISLRVRRVKWRDIGFARNRSWRMTLALGIAGGEIHASNSKAGVLL